MLADLPMMPSPDEVMSSGEPIALRAESRSSRSRIARSRAVIGRTVFSALPTLWRRLNGFNQSKIFIVRNRKESLVVLQIRLRMGTNLVLWEHRSSLILE